MSLDLSANMSSAAAIFCDQDNCDLQNPKTMTVVEDQLYILQEDGRISVFEGLCA